jgi:hypothetical protein
MSRHQGIRSFAECSAQILKLEGGHAGEIGFKMLCAGGPISMPTRLSRWALLTELAFAIPTLGPTIAEAQADVPDAANLYQRSLRRCLYSPPIFGCVCAHDKGFCSWP